MIGGEEGGSMFSPIAAEGAAPVVNYRTRYETRDLSSSPQSLPKERMAREDLDDMLY